MNPLGISFQRCLVAFAALIIALVLAETHGWAQADLHLSEMHKQPWFVDVLISSLVGWVLGMVKGFNTTKEWIEKYWTTPPKVVIFIGDALVFVLVGGYFGTAVYDPSSRLEAIAAGFSWPIGLGALTTKVGKNANREEP